MKFLSWFSSSFTNLLFDCVKNLAFIPDTSKYYMNLQGLYDPKYSSMDLAKFAEDSLKNWVISNLLLSWLLCPICPCTHVYQGVRNVFHKIWRSLFSCYLRFEIHSFGLLPKKQRLFLSIVEVRQQTIVNVFTFWLCSSNNNEETIFLVPLSLKSF